MNVVLTDIVRFLSTAVFWPFRVRAARLAAIPLALLTLPATSFAQGVDLTWRNCVGTGLEAFNQNFTCTGTVNQNYNLVVQFKSPVTLPSFVGVTVWLELQNTTPGPLAPFWHYESGGCNRSTPPVGITMSDNILQLVPCDEIMIDLWGGDGTQGFEGIAAYGANYRGPGTGVFVLSVARGSSIQLDAFVNYYAFHLTFNNRNRATCAGCDQGVALKVSRLILESDDGSPAVVLTDPDKYGNCVTINNASPGVCSLMCPPETCDGLDNDCDNVLDDVTSYRDVDGDGWGNPNVTTTGCPIPSGYVTTAGDCDDSNAARYPGATETCDGLDNDCDIAVDEGLTTTFYADADGDGYGNPASTVQACSLPPGHSANDDDCNDALATVYPGAAENCDDLDNDCDNIVDEGTLPPTGLVAWWKAEGNANDATGNYHGTLRNGATFTGGQIGQAFSLDGTDDHVSDLGTASTFAFIQNTGIFTIETWIRLDAPNALRDQSITANTPTTAENGYYFGVLNSSGQHELELLLFGGEIGIPIIHSRSPGILDDGWHHVAATGNGANVTFHVDGVAYSEPGTMGTKSSGDAARAASIGRDGVGDDFLDGQIDELAIYDRALSTAEIQRIHTLGPASRCQLVSVGEPSSAGSTIQFSAAWPNPASGAVDLEFQLPSMAPVRAQVVDVAGRRVASLVEGREMPAGRHRLHWNGLDDSGRRVLAGIYQIQVSAGGRTGVRRVVMIP